MVDQISDEEEDLIVDQIVAALPDGREDALRILLFLAAAYAVSTGALDASVHDVLQRAINAARAANAKPAAETRRLDS